LKHENNYINACLKDNIILVIVESNNYFIEIQACDQSHDAT